MRGCTSTKTKGIYTGAAHFASHIHHAPRACRVFPLYLLAQLLELILQSIAKLITLLDLPLAPLGRTLLHLLLPPFLDVIQKEGIASTDGLATNDGLVLGINGLGGFGFGTGGTGLAALGGVRLPSLGGLLFGLDRFALLRSGGFLYLGL